MDEDPRLMNIFLDVQRGLPRQGPGLDESTLHAFAMCDGLPERPNILDVGCGPGMQTIALAKATGGDIAAVDVFEEYLSELQTRAEVEGVADRITPQLADMNDLPFPPTSFDLIWSEGAAYIMGFENALSACKPLLRPGGFLAVTELVWLKAERSAEAAEFFGGEYPAMRHAEDRCEDVQVAGYELLGHFTLPDNAWWDHYYTPLEQKLPGLLQKYAGDEQALAIVKMTETEIAMRRNFATCYGYEFFVARVESIRTR